MTLNNAGNGQPTSGAAYHGGRDVSAEGAAERRPTLPAAVTRVDEETLKSFSHTKRVGNYLLGRTVGEGSFAKVKEALHVVTGELVSGGFSLQISIIVVDLSHF